MYILCREISQVRHIRICFPRTSNRKVKPQNKKKPIDQIKNIARKKMSNVTE